MKNLIKELFKGLTLPVLFLIFMTNVSATSYGLAVGATLGSSAGDTRTFANTVTNYLNSMGYSTIKRTGPTYSNLLAEMNGVSPKRWLLEADVIYLAGHGNYDNVSFSTTNKSGPEYDVFIANRATHQYGPNKGIIGVGWFNLSKVKFIMFQGCNTANQSYSNNVTAYARSKGATTTLGWKGMINRNGIADWITRFWPRIVAGDTIQQAATYAKSFYYPQNSSGVKEYKIYGSTGLRLTLSKNNVAASYQVSNQASDQVSRNEYVFEKTATKDTITDLIKKTLNKDFYNYEYTLKETYPENGDEKVTIQDYVLTVNGVETNLAYTVRIDDNEIKIYDNTEGKDFKVVKEKVEKALSRKIEKSKISEVKNNIMQKNKKISLVDSDYIKRYYYFKDHNLNEAHSQNHYLYSIKSEYKYYDAKLDKLYYNIDVESKNLETDSLLVYTEKVEI